MKSSPAVLLVLLAAPVLLAGCIGTDFLEETANTVEPRIEIMPEVSAVEIGQDLSFQAAYYDSTDAPVNTTFTWLSSDANIATVSETGDVTGVAMGQVRITASAFGISSEQALLTVVGDPNQVAFVEVMPADTSVIVRESMQFSATALNATRSPLENREITWQLSSDTLATIDATGLVTTTAPGTVQVSATAEGIQSALITLEIFAASRTGNFRAAPNTSYTVEGQAILEQISGGGLQLRFDEDFLSSNGPDLNVYLSSASTINANSLKLGQLKNTRGTQTYELPSFVEMNDYDHVVIHCLPFNVTFGSAPLR